VYLSRLVLDARRTMVRRDLGDCQELHRTLLRAFPQAPVGESGRAYAGVLFRVDVDRGQTVALVQSRLAPDWGALPDGYLRADMAEPLAVRDLDAALAGLEQGRRLRFRLRANPVRAELPHTGEKLRGRGKRVALGNDCPGTPNGRTGEQKCLDWLASKGRTAGFRLASVARSPFFDDDEAAELPDVRLAVEDDLRGFRKDAGAAGARKRLTLSPVLFEGRLDVEDAAALRLAVAQGIGPGKAYGCGLLSLARG
jgi:CRISPR system Cascade subunit CasE